MQQRQLNYKNLILLAAAALVGFFAANIAVAAPQAGDPILDGGPPGPCDAGTDGADYVGGTDANGHAVPPADLDSAPVPVPGQMLIPVTRGQGRDPAYVQADGKKLDALLNPPPACPQAKPEKAKSGR